MYQLSYYDNVTDALDDAEYNVEHEKQSYALVSMLALIPLNEVKDLSKVIEVVKYVDPEQGAVDLKYEM